MVAPVEIREIAPPAGLDSFFSEKSRRLWSAGEPAILQGKLLGIISARQIDSDLALKSSQLLKQLAYLKEVAFIGGWHSPLEEEALRILLRQLAPVVFCVSKGLDRFVLRGDMNGRVSDGRLLLLSHCSPKAKRISRDASMRRNELVVALAAALLILSAPDGTASLKLAKSALRSGRAVLTIEHRMNKELLAAGALTATFENIRTALE